MHTAQVVFEHTFDQDMLDQIQTLRSTRLLMAENMLRNLQATAIELEDRGLLVQDLDPKGMQYLELELNERVEIMRARMHRTDVVYADELTLFTDLIVD